MEIEVLHVLAQGFTDEQVGKRLHIGETTARRHLLNARHKMDAKNRVEAVAIAIVNGII